MKPSTILKYKKEFDHWLLGGSVLYQCEEKGKLWEKGWRYALKAEDTPWVDGYVYVINDEYVDLRRAAAEGKIIMYLDEKSDIVPKWKKLDILEFSKDLKYRIGKPIIEVNIGDWIREGGLCIKVYRKDLDYYYNINNIKVAKEMATKWEPIDGELVIWKPKENTFIIEKYNSCLYNKKCEPFLPELPNIYGIN